MKRSHEVVVQCWLHWLLHCDPQRPVTQAEEEQHTTKDQLFHAVSNLSCIFNTGGCTEIIRTSEITFAQMPRHSLYPHFTNHPRVGKKRCLQTGTLFTPPFFGTFLLLRNPGPTPVPPSMPSSLTASVIWKIDFRFAHTECHLFTEQPLECIWDTEFGIWCKVLLRSGRDSHVIHWFLWANIEKIKSNPQQMCLDSSTSCKTDSMSSNSIDIYEGLHTHFAAELP